MWGVMVNCKLPLGSYDKHALLYLQLAIINTEYDQVYSLCVGSNLNAEKRPTV